MTDLFLVILVFAFGASIGSFLNVVIYRMPRGESIVFPGSHCPRCGRGIAWYDNVPIVSWLALRARCRHCGTRISPQYILVELLTGLLLVGLYVAYFVLRVRTLGPGVAPVPQQDLEPVFLDVWPMFIAHAALLCGLLACSAVDLKFFQVPLPVMWTVAVIGAVAAAVSPHPFLPFAEPVHEAMGLAAGAGILLSLLAIHKGYLTPSFIDASPPRPEPAPAAAVRGKGEDDAAAKRRRKRRRRRKAARRAQDRGSIGATRESGVNPRLEVLREVLFLAPALALAAGAWALLTLLPSAGAWWACWFDPSHHPALAPRLAGVGGALFGFLIGGLWIWGTRILGTLAFGREAMGLGDVHILAGVGAVTGWAVPSLAFFVSPVTALVFVMVLLATRRSRELPYGPWLAAGTILVMLFYDPIVRWLEPGLSVLLGR